MLMWLSCEKLTRIPWNDSFVTHVMSGWVIRPISWCDRCWRWYVCGLRALGSAVPSGGRGKFSCGFSKETSNWWQKLLWCCSPEDGDANICSAADSCVRREKGSWLIILPFVVLISRCVVASLRCHQLDKWWPWRGKSLVHLVWDFCCCFACNCRLSPRTQTWRFGIYPQWCPCGSVFSISRECHLRLGRRKCKRMCCPS